MNQGARTRGRGASSEKLHWRTLVKGAGILILPSFMLVLVYVLNERLEWAEAALGIVGVFIISLIFVRPYLLNLAALTRYVEELAQDKKAEAPDLTFLNNVEELSAAVETLNRSWNDRKNQLESMLAESKILIDSLPDILVMLDDQLKIVRTNSTAQLTFGRFYNEAIESILAEPHIAKTVRQTMTSHKGMDAELVLHAPVERIFTVHVERLPIISPGGIAIILTLHDVTEIRRTEKSFADFVANASHEIRTPLTTLSGFIETLQGPAKDDTEARTKFLKIMAEQAERMSRLVTDLLSLSKIEKRKESLPTEQIHLSPLLRTAKNSLVWAAKNKRVRLRLRVERRLPILVGEAAELEQVFYNLISNAIKYSPEGSTVSIAAVKKPNIHTKEKWLRGAREVIEVTVTDEGEGIAPEHLPRLTERFYRVDSARTRQEGGTGLGLAIVKQILERHHAALLVESTVGKGSRFMVVFPLS